MTDVNVKSEPTPSSMTTRHALLQRILIDTHEGIEGVPITKLVEGHRFHITGGDMKRLVVIGMEMADEFAGRVCEKCQKVAAEVCKKCHDEKKTGLSSLSEMQQFFFVILFPLLAVWGVGMTIFLMWWFTHHR